MKARPRVKAPSVDVDGFLSTLDHPLKREIVAVRALILRVDASIGEAIKWNAPSFRTTDFFATIHLRSVDRLQLVFHTGAKVKASAEVGLEVPDPAGLLKWLAKDRAMVTLGAGPEFDAKQADFADLVAAWIRSM